MKCSDHVLAELVVHPRLPPDRTINHRHDAGGDLDEVHAPLIGRGSVADHVAYDAAAEGDEGRPAVKAVGEGRIVNQVQGGEVLEFFAVGELRAERLSYSVLNCVCVCVYRERV